MKCSRLLGSVLFANIRSAQLPINIKITGSRMDSAYVPDHFAAVTGWFKPTTASRFIGAVDAL